MMLLSLRVLCLILNRGPITSMRLLVGAVMLATVGSIRARETNDRLVIMRLGWQGRLLGRSVWIPVWLTIAICVLACRC